MSKTILRSACILFAAIIGLTAQASIVKIEMGAPEFNCEDRDNLYVPFKVVRGDVSQIERVDFVDTTAHYNKRVLVNTTKMEMNILIGGLNPGVYRGDLMVRDYISDTTLVVPFSFTIQFEGSVFKHKYYNVLAVYNETQNGGYKFTNYQWWWKNQADTIAYEGDSLIVVEPIFKPIEGATESIYHSEEELVPGDEYYVVLTYTDSLGYTNTIRSCPQLIVDKHPVIEEEEEEDSARKMIRGGRLVIRKDEHTYDIYGNKVD